MIVLATSLDSSFRSFFDAAGQFFGHLADISWGALIVALLLLLGMYLARARAWQNVLEAAYPDTPVPYRGVVGAYLAGAGINDPPERSERGIWLDGAPHEPRPVAFSGLEAIEFADGARLLFESESERARNDNLLVFRSRYRHRFGTFSGSLEGIELSEGFGVMEAHEAVW